MQSGVSTMTKVRSKKSAAQSKRRSKANAPPDDPLQPLSCVAIAKLLDVSPATVRRHVRDGAPADARKRMTLAGYVAWLVRQAG